MYCDLLKVHFHDALLFDGAPQALPCKFLCLEVGNYIDIYHSLPLKGSLARLIHTHPVPETACPRSRRPGCRRAPEFKAPKNFRLPKEYGLKMISYLIDASTSLHSTQSSAPYMAAVTACQWRALKTTRHWQDCRKSRAISLHYAIHDCQTKINYTSASYVAF